MERSGPLVSGKGFVAADLGPCCTSGQQEAQLGASLGKLTQSYQTHKSFQMSEDQATLPSLKKHWRSPGSPEAAGRGQGQNSRASWMSPPSGPSGFLARASTCSPNLFPVFIFFQFSSSSWFRPHSAQRPLLLSQSFQRNLSVPSTLPGLHFELHRRGSGRFSPSHQASQTLLNVHGGRGCAGPEDAIVIRMVGLISWN